MQNLSFSTLFRSRIACQSICCVAVGHLTLVALGLPSWQCPVRFGLGIPCPGCGITRALMALAIGNWQQAIAIHAFAPVVAIGLLPIMSGALLPRAYKIKLHRQINWIEQRTKLSILLSSLFLFYWLVRIIFFNKELFRLVM